MKFFVEFRPRAEKELKALPTATAKRISRKILELENGLTPGVKKLTGFRPESRLRVGNFRVLFETEGEKLVVYRVAHRREAYR